MVRFREVKLMKNIKKFFAILLVTILSVSTVAFAGETDSANQSEYPDSVFIQNAKQIVTSDFAETDYDTCKYFIANQVGMVKEAFESFLPFTEEGKMGQFVGVADEGKVDRTDDGLITCTVTMVYTNGKVDASVVYKKINGQPTPVSISFKSADEEQDSFGTRMANAGLNTLIGMSTVVLVLLIIMFVIYLFKFIPILQNKFSNKEKKNETEVAVDNAIAQITENEEVTDDLELVAVITAAISAQTGISSDGFVVRSIRKAKRSR